jgi:hypothetical protein
MSCAGIMDVWERSRVEWALRGARGHTGWARRASSSQQQQQEGGGVSVAYDGGQWLDQSECTVGSVLTVDLPADELVSQ